MDRDEDTTPPGGIKLRHAQEYTREQLLNMVQDTLTAIEFDLDVLTQGFGLLMKEHNLEKQWKELQRSMSKRRRIIGDGE